MGKPSCGWKDDVLMDAVDSLRIRKLKAAAKKQTRLEEGGRSEKKMIKHVLHS